MALLLGGAGCGDRLLRFEVSFRERVRVGVGVDGGGGFAYLLVWQVRKEKLLFLLGHPVDRVKHVHVDASLPMHNIGRLLRLDPVFHTCARSWMHLLLCLNCGPSANWVSRDRKSVV